MSGVLCLFAEEYCACSDSTDLGQATPFPKGGCEPARPLHYANQPRVTGNADPELLLSPQRRKRALTAGLSPLELPTQQSYIGTWCHWHPCSSRLLGQSAYASHVSVSGCEFGPARFSEMSLMTRVIGAALLALRAVSYLVKLGSQLLGELSLGRYS